MINKSIDIEAFISNSA